MPVSLNPQTFMEGGLFDDVDALFSEVQFCYYDYQGKVSPPVLSLGINMRVNTDEGVKDFAQYYSMGEETGNSFQPSADGFSLDAKPGSTKSAPTKNSNFHQFMNSLLQAGFPVEQLQAGYVSCLVGVVAHVNRVAQPKRAGIIRKGPNADREQQILLVSRIVQMPGQAPVQHAAQTQIGIGVPARPAVASVAAPQATTGPTLVAPTQSTGVVGVGVGAAKVGGLGVAGSKLGQSATPAPATITTVPADPAVDQLTAQVLGEILTVAGGTLPKSKLPQLAFTSQTLAGNPAKTAVVSRIFEDSFLGMVGGVRFDGATVSLQ